MADNSFSSPYAAPMKQNTRGKYPRSGIKALKGLPQVDHATNSGAFKSQFGLEAPGGGTNSGPGGQIQPPGHGWMGKAGL